MKISLKTKLIFIFTGMMLLTVSSEIIRIYYFKLPQLYSLEASADKKDIARIINAFDSAAHELAVVNYDNAVWNDTYNYVENRDNKYITNNFVQDTYTSLNINGIHIYDKQGVLVWGKTLNNSKNKTIQFSAFDLPSSFVEKNLLFSSQLTKPHTKSGYTFLENKLVQFSATSIFKANLKGVSNGTMIFWRFVDINLKRDLQKRSGIKFDIEIVENTLKKKSKK